MQICPATDATCQRLQEIADGIGSIAEWMEADATAGWWAEAGNTLVATLVGAVLALVGSWLLFKLQRRGDRSDRLDERVATIVDSLGNLESALLTTFAPLEEQVDNAFPGAGRVARERAAVLGQIRVARIHANGKEREVLAAAFENISARDWPKGREAQNAERVANILVAWREGTHKPEAAITELQGRYHASPPPKNA